MSVTVGTEGSRSFTFELSVPELATWEDMPEAVERQLGPDVLEKLEEYEGEGPHHGGIREIAEKYGDSLPLILGKWGLAPPALGDSASTVLHLLPSVKMRELCIHPPFGFFQTVRFLIGYVQLVFALSLVHYSNSIDFLEFPLQLGYRRDFAV